MATAAKPQKDKPSASRLAAPRPTAASAARAARNAMNRNLAEVKPPPAKRLSPNRKPPTAVPSYKKPNPTRLSTPTLQNQQSVTSVDKIDPRATKEKFDTKSEVNVKVSQENFPQETNASITSGSDTYVVDCSPPNAYESIRESPELSTRDLENLTHTFEIIQEDVSKLNVMEEDMSPGEDVVPPLSQPLTPIMGSRPMTPKSVRSSRPQTPQTPIRSRTPETSRPSSRPASGPTSRPPSRPTTPARRLLTPPQRPSTPNAAPSSAIPVPVNRTSLQLPTTACPTVEEEDLQSILDAKQREFHTLKKELDIKQHAILEVFDNIRKLSKRMEGAVGACGEGVNMQELVIFNVGDWTSEEISQLCREAAASLNHETALELFNRHMDESTLVDMNDSVSKIPSTFAELCLQAFSTRQEIIDWIKELVDENVYENTNDIQERIAFYNTQGLELCEALRVVKTQADNAVASVTQIARAALDDRSSLIAVGESLVRELAKLRQDLEARSQVVSDMKKLPQAETDAKELVDTRRQLEEERAARAAMKEKLASTEMQLKQTRIRVNKMDRQLREAEASIVSLTSTVKSLEDQSRQREVQLEARARKLKESLKTGEITNSHIAQQRDNLLSEVQTLKEQLEALTAQNKSTVKELTQDINELKAALANEKRATEDEMQKNKQLEEEISQLRVAFDDYKTRHPEIEINNELPTEREIDLWAELQATKDTLRITEDEVTACKREKVRFLETLTKISESENKIGMQQKLAAELLSKEEIIGKMQLQIRELTKNMKLNEQKVIQYEQYVRDQQAHYRAVANCQEAPNGISYEDLQQEIMKLKMNLLDVGHRNEELSELLSQKEQQLEQQDKTSRAQARIIKVREELINMLKNKETEQSIELTNLQQDLEHRMKIVDDVNKQIAAKADEIQELFLTLESKQQQIHRLEKIVLALEEQQRRAQAQRTRHEEKIAALEHELAAGSRRERRFLFF